MVGSRGGPLPADRPAEYARAARWVVDRWGDDIAAIEVWNEPNYDAFFKTSDLNGDYAALLKAAYPEIKAADPGVTVLGPAMLMSDAAWLDELYDEGIGSFDAISMHPFNYGFAPGDETNRWGLKVLVRSACPGCTTRWPRTATATRRSGSPSSAGRAARTRLARARGASGRTRRPSTSPTRSG